ncbi:MAG: hypothetical protein K5637_04680 [Lachnospiraceae bacterium]|nr:hypothetical protein [Lachnospiraceae bacterium]
MTLTELLENDKEIIISNLKQAKTPERAGAVLESELDTLMYRYSEQCESNSGRNASAYMLQTARTAVPIVDSIGETSIWERSGNTPVKENKSIPLISKIMLVLGIVGAAFAIVLLATDVSSMLQLQKLPAAIISAAAGVLFTYISGATRKRKPKEQPEPDRQVEISVDAEKLYRYLYAMSVTMDRNLRTIAEEETQRAQISGGADREELEDSGGLEVIAGLLEASYSGDGQFALDKIQNLKYYLHKSGIDVLDYSEETENYFDMIPSKRPGTIRPALMSKGKLIKKGLAGGF